MLLRVKSEFIPLIQQGLKSSTVRAGRRAVREGPAEVVSGRKSLAVVITRVEYKKFSALNDDDAKKDGFRDAEELEAALRQIYPDIHTGDDVTIIHFKLAASTEHIDVPGDK